MKAAHRASRLGLLLFSLYCLAYGLFVATAAFRTFQGGAPTGGLAGEAAFGLTWGVVGGFGLIMGAFALALIYAARARVERERDE